MRNKTLYSVIWSVKKETDQNHMDDFIIQNLAMIWKFLGTISMERCLEVRWMVSTDEG